MRYDPRRYQQQGGSRRTPPSPAHPAQGPVRFVPYEFRAVDWPTEPHVAGVLYVAGGGTSLPPSAHTVKEIPDVAGRTSVVLFAFDGPRA